MAIWKASAISMPATRALRQRLGSRRPPAWTHESMARTVNPSGPAARNRRPKNDGEEVAHRAAREHGAECRGPRFRQALRPHGASARDAATSRAH